jgi:hypothetical protein
MRRKFRVELCRPVFDGIMKHGVVNPMVIKTCCQLLGLNPAAIGRKNQLMMYFMLTEPREEYDRTITPTDLEKKQIGYIKMNMSANISKFIAELDGDIQVDDERTFDKTQLLDVLFSAADTSQPQSHSEDENTQVFDNDPSEKSDNGDNQIVKPKRKRSPNGSKRKRTAK